jgi:hypothetical protein
LDVAIARFLKLQSRSRISFSQQKNDLESHEYHRESTSKIKRTYDHMGTWLAGVHPMVRRNKAAPSKIPQNSHLKPTNEGKTSTKCDLTVESVIGQLNGHHFIRSWREKTKRTQPKQQHNALMNLASSCMVSEAKPALRGGSVSWVGGKTGRCSGWR